MYKIGFTKHADKEFKNLPSVIKDSMRKVLNGVFVQDPYNHSLAIKKLHEPLTGYRLRVGSYRILYLVEDDYIKVYKIEHRKDAYK